jgi:hypothetical protein
MSALEALLPRLERVKQTGKNKWMACCPAHEDSTPSLSIRSTDDGRVLIHDFGGCSTESVLDALNLTMSDLFEGPLGHHFAPIYGGRFTANELLASIAHETFVARLILEDAKDSVLSTEAMARLDRALVLIGKAESLVNAR